MSRVSINETTLTAIGDAIREKTGKTELIAPGDMPAEITAIVSGGADPVIESLEITANGTYNAYEGVDGFAPVVVNVPQDGGPPASAFNISGRTTYMFANGVWDWFITQHGNKITTNIESKCEYMFNACQVEIPFEINLKGKNIDATSMFLSYSGPSIPKINAEYPPYNMNRMFNLLQDIEYFPEGFGEDWDWTYHETMTSAYGGTTQQLFAQCNRLRAVPEALIRTGNPLVASSSNIYYEGFRRCYRLEKINNLVAYETLAPGFSKTFEECERLKDLTFRVQEDGTPFVRKWNYQTIDLTKVGFGTMSIGYGSLDQYKVDGDMTKYLGYVNDSDNPDGWASSAEWSVYNRKSAVRTINSLPDTSTATSGGNIIKFKSTAASGAGQEYAMANLSDAEIAVAAAKGWTVTLA